MSEHNILNKADSYFGGINYMPKNQLVSELVPRTRKWPQESFLIWGQSRKIYHATSHSSPQQKAYWINHSFSRGVRWKVNFRLKSSAAGIRDTNGIQCRGQVKSTEITHPGALWAELRNLGHEWSNPRNGSLTLRLISLQRNHSISSKSGMAQ